MSGVVFAAYVAVFGAAAFACFGGLWRVGDVDDPDTRRGLRWLLATSGGWATAQAAFLVLPGTTSKVAVYVVGLVFGVATVGAWLYFCSAYTGRTHHRNRTVRRIAVAAFLVLVAVKVTNPVHGLYFSVTPTATPFPHLAVEHHVLHWLAMGGSYALAAVGYFVLFELFTQTGYDTKPLLGLVSLTGLPVLADVVGGATPHLLELSYESVGVAVFAVGVLFVYDEQFQAVQLAGDVDDAVVFLTEADRVRQANERARDLFPGLAAATGAPLEAAAPALADCLAGDRDVLELERGGEQRYYQVSATPFTFGRTRVGRMVVVADVTREERARREIQRQNERLGQFASVVSHDLRNPLNVAVGRLELARDRVDDENLDAVARSLERMEQLIEGVLTLAREGADIGDRERASVAALAEQAWASVATGDADLVVADDLAFEADADRVVQLLENLFRNSVEHGSTGNQNAPRSDDAVEHGSTGPRSQARQDAVEHGSTGPRSRAHEDAVEHGGPTVTVRVGALADGRGFYVEDDGPGVPESERETVFEMGESGADGTGIGLAIVETIAEAHGWTVSVTDAAGGDADRPGARFEITGVDPLAD